MRSKPKIKAALVRLEIKRESTQVGDPGEVLGDIVTVAAASNEQSFQENAVKMPRTGYLVITDAPVTVDQLRFLTRSVWHAPIDAEDPHSGGVRLLHEWTIIDENLPQLVRDQFAAKGYAEITWAQALGAVYSKESDAYLSEVEIIKIQPVR